MTTIRFGAVALSSFLCAASMATSYTVKPGDSISGIAHKFHVTRKALISANDLKNADSLSLGQHLHIPGSSADSSSEDHHRTNSHRSSGTAFYTVRNGDNDWAISHRLHVSERDLHSLNSDLNWDRIQPGQKIQIPADGEAHHPSKEKSTDSGDSDSSSHGKYKVEEGDNDWKIAAKLGVSHAELRKLNPDVKWTAIHPGEKLTIPGRAVASRKGHKSIQTRYAVIDGDNVTLRRRPSTDSNKVTSVDAGTVARVLDRESGWYKLRFPKGTEAWVKGEFLNPVTHHTTTYASHKSRRSTRTTRTAYASHYKRHGRTHHEEPVAMAEMNDGGLLSTAYSFRGTRYVTGGTSRSSGFDCSGFTSTVYKKNGVKIPRTSIEQSSAGQHVDKEHLQKGDLVFFRTNRGIRINHVGMYIGNGKFIHASSGGGHVQVSSLNEGYYNRRFATARRIVKAKKAKTENPDE